MLASRMRQPRENLLVCGLGASCGLSALAPLAVHLRPYCVMNLVCHGLLTTFVIPTLCLSSSLCAALTWQPPFCSSPMSLGVSAWRKTFDPSICTAGVAKVWCIRNVPATLGQPLRQKQSNMVAGVSVAAPLICVRPILNDRRQTKSALLSFLWSWGGRKEDEGFSLLAFGTDQDQW
jgi:hypothetical protein